MALPLKPPIKPQLALSRKVLPEGEDWVYEPKYDGFRAIAYVDGDDVYMQSRGGKPLRRYFPEVTFPEGRYVLDGELVILDEDGREQFDALQNRLHPAESRVRMLAEQTPALFRAFDLLAVERRKLTGKPFAERRAALEKLIAEAPGRKKRASGSVEVTPLYKTARSAEPLLLSGEGVIAKELDAIYKPGQRKGMVKVKRVRTIDCVVMGWRPGKHEGTVGSLILGLYENGKLRPIGHTSGLKAKEKKELVKTLAPYETGEKGSGDPSRWDANRELEWFELRPELVVEVTYDHTSGGRIRHGSKIVRWREDKAPEGLQDRPAVSRGPGLASAQGETELEDVGPDVDLPGRGDDQHRDRHRHRDEGRGEQLVPLSPAAGDRPGGEREEDGGQLEHGVGERREDEQGGRDVLVPGDRRADQPEADGLGAGGRSRSRRSPRRRRCGQGLLVDHPFEAGPPPGGASGSRVAQGDQHRQQARRSATSARSQAQDARRLSPPAPRTERVCRIPCVRTNWFASMRVTHRPTTRPRHASHMPQRREVVPATDSASIGSGSLLDVEPGVAAELVAAGPCLSLPAGGPAPRRGGCGGSGSCRARPSGGAPASGSRRSGARRVGFVSGWGSPATRRMSRNLTLQTAQASRVSSPQRTRRSFGPRASCGGGSRLARPAAGVDVVADVCLVDGTGELGPPRDGGEVDEGALDGR